MHVQTITVEDEAEIEIGREHQMKDIDVYVDEAYLAPITELPEIAS